MVSTSLGLKKEKGKLGKMRYKFCVLQAKVYLSWCYLRAKKIWNFLKKYKKKLFVVIYLCFHAFLSLILRWSNTHQYWQECYCIRFSEMTSIFLIIISFHRIFFKWWAFMNGLTMEWEAKKYKPARLGNTNSLSECSFFPCRACCCECWIQKNKKLTFPKKFAAWLCMVYSIDYGFGLPIGSLVNLWVIYGLCRVDNFITWAAVIVDPVQTAVCRLQQLNNMSLLRNHDKHVKYIIPFYFNFKYLKSSN